MGPGAAQRNHTGGIRKPAHDARPRPRSRGLDEGREAARRCRHRGVQSCARQRCEGARRADRIARRIMYNLSQAISAQRVSPPRRFEMNYSRRNFLKAAGSGIALTAIGEGCVIAAAVAPLALAAPMTSEKSAFLINGKLHVAE